VPELTRLLCPVDFSDPSRHAVDHAVVLARWYGASITALHVRELMAIPSYELVTYESPAQVDPTELERLRQTTAAFFEQAVAAGVNVTTRVEVGQPATGIVEAARSLPASLIVMGTHGASGFDHLILGSVTEKVLRKAPCPVMTVPPRARATSALPFKRILCPVDFSESSKGALDFAFSLAQEGDAELTILHVLEWPSDEEPPSTRAFNVPEYHLYREAEARKQLDALVPASVRDWCSPTTTITHGKPYREILGHAAEGGADLIIIGVRGRSAIDRMLFGSTTNQVIRRATCPVLTLQQ